jgi:hypothetical protein
MTLPHAIEAAVGLGLASLLAWRLWKLPAVFKAAALGSRAEALTGQSTTVPLAQQPAAVQWVTGTVGPTAVTTAIASNWYDPTKATVPQTFNEFGFITSPLPAPVNPKTNAVPLTNIDICNWAGHMPGTPCPRCGT